jgi:hypothetical protein
MRLRTGPMTWLPFGGGPLITIDLTHSQTLGYSSGLYNNE